MPSTAAGCWRWDSTLQCYPTNVCLEVSPSEFNMSLMPKPCALALWDTRELTQGTTESSNNPSLLSPSP